MNPDTAKPFWQSKTIWLQVLALLSLFIPPVAQWVKNNPVEPLAALAALSVLVRFVTSGRVSIFPDDESGSSSTAGKGDGGPRSGGGLGGPFNGMQCMRSFSSWLGVAACAAIFFLPSCSQEQLAAFRAMPVQIGIAGQHGTYRYSNDGGLSVELKAPVVREEKRSKEMEDFNKRLRDALAWDPHRDPQPRRLCQAEVPMRFIDVEGEKLP